MTKAEKYAFAKGALTTIGIGYVSSLIYTALISRKFDADLRRGEATELGRCRNLGQTRAPVELRPGRQIAVRSRIDRRRQRIQYDPYESAVDVVDPSVWAGILDAVEACFLAADRLYPGPLNLIPRARHLRECLIALELKRSDLHRAIAELRAMGRI